MPDEVTALTVAVEGGSLLLQALTPEETEAWTKLRLPPPWCLQLGLRDGELWGVAAGQPVPPAPSPWKCPSCGLVMVSSGENRRVALAAPSLGRGSVRLAGHVGGCLR